MSRAQSSKIKNCRVELKWKETLDWWLIGSPTYKLQESNRLIKGATQLRIHLYCGLISPVDSSSTVYASLLWKFHKKINIELNQQSKKSISSVKPARDSYVIVCTYCSNLYCKLKRYRLSMTKWVHLEIQTLTHFIVKLNQQS